MSEKFVENLRKVGRSPRLLGAVTAADALVGLRFECVGKAGPGAAAIAGPARTRASAPQRNIALPNRDRKGAGFATGC